MLYPLVISFVCLFVITGAFDAIVAVQKTMVKQQMMSKIVKVSSYLESKFNSIVPGRV